MILPTIHLNGTHPRDLYAQAGDAAHALREAIRKLEEATPHGRDYHLQGPQALYKAQAHHESRVDMVRTVLADMEALMAHAADDPRM